MHHEAVREIGEAFAASEFWFCHQRIFMPPAPVTAESALLCMPCVWLAMWSTVGEAWPCRSEPPFMRLRCALTRADTSSAVLGAFSVFAIVIFHLSAGVSGCPDCLLRIWRLRIYR